MKKRINELVSLLTASSVLFSSCSEGILELSGYSYLNLDRGKFAKNNLDGFSLVSIKKELSNEEIQYVKNASNLSLSMMKDRSLLKKFIDNPHSVLLEYGLSDLNIGTNDNIQAQAISALADEDVYNAIQNNDLETFLKLLKKKNILQTDIVKSLNEIIETKDFQTMKTRSSFAESEYKDGELISPIAICALAVGIYVVLATCFAVEVAFWVHFAVSGLETTKEDEETLKLTEEDFFISQIKDDQAIKLFISNNTNGPTYEIFKKNEIQVAGILKETIETISPNTEPEEVNKIVNTLSETVEKYLNVNDEE